MRSFLKTYRFWKITKKCYVIFLYISNYELSFTDSTMCGDPEQPVFSIVNRTSASTVQYSCVKGHRMEGGTGERLHCSDKGVWIGSPPKCVGKCFTVKN